MQSIIQKFNIFIILTVLFSYTFENSLAQTSLQPKVIKPFQFIKSRPLKDITPIPPGTIVRKWEKGEIKIQKKERPKKPGALPEGIDPVLQDKFGSLKPSQVIIQNFEGVNNVNGVLPPDNNGDVGPNHYMQMINLSFGIWDKSGNKVYGPADNITLWEDLPGPWSNTNDGDPIVLYDQQAGRWLASQFALPNFPYGPFYELIAISATDDPTDSWYLYAFEFDDMPDYPKFGVWTDGYYMSANTFASGSTSWIGTYAAAFEKDKMIIGDPNARMILFELSPSDDPWSMLPSDWDGNNTPPASSPNYFIYFNDDAWGYDYDQLRIREFHVDWNNINNSTFKEVSIIQTNAFDWEVNEVPQKSTSQKLDVLSDRMMFRLQYRNFGNYEAMVTNHTVDAYGNGIAGIRWYELHKSGSQWEIYQQGTYAPNDGKYRWMGSIAMDKNGNIALGYSVSNSSNFPSIKYTGRYINSVLGEMTIDEQEIIAGNGSQTHWAGRWGDYTFMAVDPNDDQTFWYTNEYLQTTGSAPWRTRIASFQLEHDSIPPLAISDLSIDSIASNSILLKWTAPGDDGTVGKVASYDLRFSTTAIDENNFISANKVSDVIIPKPSGETETFIIKNLDFNTTYYFAIKAIDEQANESDISNLPYATTLSVPIITVDQTSLTTDLLSGEIDTLNLTINNTSIEESTLDYLLSIESTSKPVKSTFQSIRNIKSSNNSIQTDDIPNVVESVSWLNLNPISGTIKNGQSSEIKVRFNSANLFGGKYEANINILSNDPERNTITIPVTMNVTGVPNISVSSTNLNFGNVFITDTAKLTLIIRNIGTDSLFVNSISSENSDYSTDITNFKLSVKENKIITVTFVPSTNGSITSNLVVISNDPDESTLIISLNGIGVEPPEIVVNPTYFDEKIKPGEIITKNMEIKNVGVSDLSFNILLGANFENNKFNSPNEKMQNNINSDLVNRTQSNNPSAMWDLLFNYDVSSSTKDQQCFGVEFDGDFFYVSGKGFTNVPAIYKFDKNGNYISGFNVPGATQNGSGFKDLAWDGNYLYGSDDDTITVFDTNGNLIREFKGPLKNNFNLAYDSETQHLWVSNESSDFYEIDLNGNVIKVHSNPGFLNATGFAWDKYSAGGPFLWIFEGSGINLAQTFYQYKPDVGLTDISFEVNLGRDGKSGGAFITTEWDPGKLVLGGLSQGSQDRIFGYELFNYTNWLSVNPQSGIIPKDSSLSISINFDGTNLAATSLSDNSEWIAKSINQIASIYRAYLIINSNDPTDSKINIPISVNVDSFKNFIVSLDSNWNLISWNVILENDSTKNILKDIKDNLVIALGYENNELVFDPNNQPENNTLNFMNHLHGYWLKMKQPDELSILGLNAHPQSLMNLKEGWNLVSYLPIQPDSISNALKSISDNLIVVLGYDKGGLMYDPKIPDEFNTLKIMQPGYGYWIKTISNDTLIYPDTNILSSSSNTILQNNLNVFPTNEWIGIWGDEVKINDNLISVGTVVRAIDNNGVICGEFVVSNEGKFGLMPIYRDDFRTEFDEGAEVGEDVSLYFGDYKFPKGVKWTEMGAVVDLKDLVVSVNDDISILPKEFELYQNFPNPFNPTTIIKFAIPIKSKINLSIYNILGEKIDELMNDELDAGYYEKEWNASKFASGIYFYRIVSGSFVKTKKLILLK